MSSVSEPVTVSSHRSVTHSAQRSSLLLRDAQGVRVHVALHLKRERERGRVGLQLPSSGGVAPKHVLEVKRELHLNDVHIRVRVKIMGLIIIRAD
jgi:hypothetical protein